MWDNRLSKRNPKAPDFKCRDRDCDGVVWPPRASAEERKGAGGRGPGDHQPVPQADRDASEFPDALRDQEDELPF
jgi:hypothetical protein